MTHPTEDYYAWAQETLEKLRQGRLNEVNMDDLIEELEDIAKSERRALESRLSVPLMHLLKWHYQPKNRCHSWRGTIKEQRYRVKRLLQDNPSFKPQLPAIGVESFESAVFRAMAETNLDETTFPSTFEDTGWTWEEVLDSEFYPD